jgi:hypothetical protein
LRFIYNWIRKDAQLFDLNLDEVARLHEQLWLARNADAGWRAGDNQVAGAQSNRLAEERDECCNVKDHVARVGFLNDRAVEARLQLEAICAGRNLIGPDERGPESTRVVEVFAGVLN